MSRQARTKICIVQNCEFSKGTRLPIQMFTVPQDIRRRELWEKSFTSQASQAKFPLSGMICINHFCDSDLQPAIKSKRIYLKNDAVPKIFSTKKSDNHSHEVDPVDRDDPNNLVEPCSHESCAHIRIKYEELCKERINHDVQVQKLQKLIADSKASIQIQTDHIKRLDKGVKRMTESKDKLKIVIAELQQKNMLRKDATDILEKLDDNEVLACLMNGVKPGDKYPESVRKFCLNLTYHSPAAYEVVRKRFNNNLPHQRTIKAWFAQSDISGEPGLTEGTLKRLKGFVNEMNGDPLICTLIFDEMYLREQVSWDENKMDYVGFISYGLYGEEKKNKKAGQGNKNHEAKNPKPSDNIPFAKKAMNFMLSGINRNFQFPLAYHLVRDLEADELKALLSDIIVRVSECGIKIAVLSFDGDKKNIAMCKLFGANLNVFDPDFKPYIESPYDKNEIFLTLDPSHMEKLTRNLLGNHQVLFNESQKKIEWKYFVELENLSKGGDMLTHRLTRKHIEFQQNKMNVQLANETFSQSCADSMQILKNQKHPLFLNCEASIEFTTMMDKLFNLLNSKTKRHENIFKQALSPKNKNIIFAFIQKTINYLTSLKMTVSRGRDGEKANRRMFVLKTIHKTPILGFIMDLTNLRLFYEKYVERDKIMNEVNTFTFSQDHIEIFHAKIRSRNGHNTNPNVIQFRGAFRRLQCNSEIKAPESANCIAFDGELGQMDILTPQSNVYFVSSRRPKLDIMNDEMFQGNLANQCDLIIDEVGVLEDLTDIEGIEETAPIIDGLAGASIAYAARLIEKKIETKTFYCDCCKLVFSQNSKLSDPFIYTIESKKPCSSTFYICKIADRFLKLYKPKFLEENQESAMDDTGVQNYRRDFRVLFYMIFKEIDLQRVYAESDFLGHEEHKFHLVKCIIKEYIRIKTSQISKQITLSHYDKLLRTKLTRWIHFAGQ